jgi:hypothetical protein
MRDEELWRKERLWFGASFEWRDQYLEIALGHLHWLLDVMPHVIVLGDYSCYGDFTPSDKFTSDGLAKALSAVRDSFGQALEIYQDRYDEIERATIQLRRTDSGNAFAQALGDEVKDEELRKYYA